jgi:two-component system sensor histidine kinase BarA
VTPHSNLNQKVEPLFSRELKPTSPFISQADQSITRLHGGTGLGLVICQRLAYEMKGDVGFSSRENNGSTFWFKFECGVTTLPLSNELDTLRLANKTILYYEPHLHSRAATYDILLNWKMQITQVESISQLTEALENSKQTKKVFDYALIGHDRNSTALSGLKKIITQVKPQISNIHLAINSNSPSLQDALLASGALSCLSKPITAYKLYTALLADQGNLLPPSKKILPIKVLAVDDNEANLKLINALLLEQVSDVVLAENGMKAFELCKDEKFDLIFMDIQMPIMDGISTLKAIKNDICNSKTPVIAVTAHALSGEKEKMQQQGFNAYMTKPIDETMLNHIIYEYCDVNHFINSTKQHLSIATKTIQHPQAIANKASVVMDWSLALHRTGGKENLAIAMLTGLVDSLAESHKNISNALINQDTEQLKSLIHKLNGACCYTGVPNLTTICQELETQLKSGITLENLEPEFLEFFEQIEQVAIAAPKLLAELEIAELEKNNTTS